DSSGTYYLTDLITGDVISGLPENLSNVQVSLNAFTTKILFLADSIVQFTGIGDVASDKPGSFELLQNYPNPFNPATNIRFTLPSSGHVILKVYDILGNEAAVLINGYLAAGFHTSVFNGSSLSSGVYFYRIEFDNKINTKKMVFIK
ncbi:MAG: T9SS type A sorting domain-containing protein, partial [Ignavibacteria bacterium]